MKATERAATLVTLRKAIERWHGEEDTEENVYDWYRRDALRFGSVSIGDEDLSTFKMGGTWVVREADLDHAIEAHRASRADVKRITADYAAGILHGHDDETVEMVGGGYLRQDPFHFLWSDYDRGRNRSYGTWYCNRCMEPASTEHNNEECHRCSDWGSCGRDCTLSRVFCAKCDTGFDLEPYGVIQDV
jgi:hypothetical protein